MSNAFDTNDLSLGRGRLRGDPGAWRVEEIRRAVEAGLELDSAKASVEGHVDAIVAAYRLNVPAARLVERATAVSAGHWRSRGGNSSPFEQVLAALRTRTGAGRPDLLAQTVLVEALSQGDGEAMVRLDQSFRTQFLESLRKIGRERAVQELEGLFTDCLLRPDRYFDGYKGRCELDRWLARIARSASSDQGRRMAREAKHIAALQVAARSETDASDGDSIDEYEGCVGLLLEIARKAVASISPREALMLRMVHLDELKPAEYARVVKKHRATVSRRLSSLGKRLMDRIRQLIRESGRESLLTEFMESPTAFNLELAKATAEALYTRVDATTDHG